ncbi:Downstream Of DAF-16 (regulated by DAF-16) [Caenorhabditis elegans]|uniref:Downstream Of DAF-16 (Regulated by DAF-16) n=1 Tax=Caenorhabditis elegans TaxID=6239 RepID=P91002_CAEEL|nr:Downstream Of DAF-16 (regulated by DAF-16) [Caenorhabditis elegans]CCD62232.2 Downstream Of DAF-16 (regulated by DAF-16) [Caenorhabditis elegans]|eukprot:NP_503196.2 Downstream Of DAF-16 (regulated by DAF-16) [Caenorhabditis elegans]
MTFLSIFLISGLFLCGSAQKLMSLSSFKGTNVKNNFKAHAPYNIYVSADSDAEFILQQIFVITGNEQNVTLLDLKKNLQASGEITAFPVQKSAYITTTLSDNELKTLNGVIYLSSRKQRADTNFHVYGVSKSPNIILRGMGNLNTTILFLNTIMGTNPSSIISQWSQDSTAHAYLYTDFPLDTAEETNTQIFSNPMHTDKADLYFANVEKFSLSLVAFYLKTYRGVNFSIEPGYYSIDGKRTSAFTTTGFYMKPLARNASTITVNIKRDVRYSGASGANLLGHVPKRGKVTVGFYNGDSKYEESFPPSYYFSPWSIPYIDFETFKVSSTSSNSTAEYYFVQYFVAQGTLFGSPTSGPIQTATQSSGVVQLFVSMAISTMYWL